MELELLILAFALVAVGLVAATTAVAAVLLFVRHRELSRRLAAAETQLRQLQPAPQAPEAATSTSAAQEPVRGWQLPGSAAGLAVPLAPNFGSNTGPNTGPLFVDRAFAWFKENWFYAIAAVSLGLAGIFLVQYGIEKGFLPPTARVLAALAFGGVLIAGGEFVRRKWGDDEDSPAALLPSTFSSAGVVVLYAAVISARSLYGLMGSGSALAALVVVSALGIGLGWRYGPLLTAIALLGASAAPFLVNGEAESGNPFYVYYALLAAVGLVIDAKRQWHWVSALALTSAYAVGAYVVSAGGSYLGFTLLMIWLTVASVTLPRLEIWPTHPAPAMVSWLRSRKPPAPSGSVLFAGAASVVSAVLILSFGNSVGPTKQVIGMVALAALAIILTLWTKSAPGLRQLAATPAAAYLTFIVTTDRATNADLGPFSPYTLVIALALLVAAACAWRSWSDSTRLDWTAGASFFAPLTVFSGQLWWRPVSDLGEELWAAHVFAVAILMAALALRYAQLDVPAGDPGATDRRRVAWAALSAISLVTLAAFVLLTDVALTVAVAALIATAAGLDRRFRLLELSWFITGAGALLTWLLVADPGLEYYLTGAPLWEVLLAFGAAVAALVVVFVALPEAPKREYARRLAQAGLWSYSAVLAVVLLFRLLDWLDWEDEGFPLALYGMIGFVVAMAQLYQLRTGVRVPLISWALLLAWGFPAGVALLMPLLALHPYSTEYAPVLGPLIFDSAAVAYALPALALLGLAAFARWLPWRWAFRLAGVIYLANYVFLEIRRFFHDGQTYSGLGFTQPELYAYTVALLLFGGGLLYRAIDTPSPELRRVAIGVIGVAVAKVFLVDAQDLSGLLRVFSFLALGLVLAGLAWLNRWAAQRAAEVALG